MPRKIVAALAMAVVGNYGAFIVPDGLAEFDVGIGAMIVPNGIQMIIVPEG